MLFVLFILIISAGCGAAGDTAAGHGLSLPEGSESVVPLPAEAAIVMAEATEETAVVLFRPGLTWPESVAFFTQGFAGRGWTLDEQEIPELDQGERTAAWRARGHGVRVVVNVTAFGGPEGANLSGVLMVEPED
ncbi:MAG: hypothetical protein EA422_02690 [Gemmatimonadales bacterium]|nr:MAG: hypothetical protein EA422_02690 [Gemmatimonadales bacterium]